MFIVYTRYLLINTNKLNQGLVNEATHFLGLSPLYWRFQANVLSFGMNNIHTAGCIGHCGKRAVCINEAVEEVTHSTQVDI